MPLRSTPLTTLARCWVLVAAMAACAAPVLAAEATPQEPAYLYVTAPGDTLIGLGRRLLIDPQAWPELGRANVISNPNRIPAGQTLRIPLRLMVTERVPAVVTAVTGEARTAVDAPVAVGQSIPEGAELRTGSDGNVSIRLIDGTRLRLRANSRLLIDESKRVPKADAVRSGVLLEQGQVEVDAQPANGGKPGFRVNTPQGVLGVRGTEFRVHAEGRAGTTRSEVLEGVVAASGQAAQPAQVVGAGFGVLVDSTGSVGVPVALLPAPAVSALPALQEELLVRFMLDPLGNAVAYRGRISADASFEQVLANERSPSPELRFAGLPDGDYVLRIRGIAANGLEGIDAQHRFRLKARPEPPLPGAPAPRAVLSDSRVEFAWTANPQARSYRFQLSRSEDFVAPLRDLRGQTGTRLVVEDLTPGIYRWRVASERSDTDQGPFGEPQQFELRAVPVPPAPAVDGKTLRIGWTGRPGQTFEVQLSRDAAFTSLMMQREVSEPKLELTLPDGGRFHVRLRARDPDGYVGPFTTPQVVDIPVDCLKDTRGECVRASGEAVTFRP